ncbi:allophanate hydrolase [Raphidocelis subcapitata]|uniref:Allophanate hydrolase n=1 Tax=Raphidocelis subcapitata TaxID=307507 RepID=A0A2V0PMC9_9CHLO|nr:allophanate hydrolase [Raphidocelis subcapitata]|eukprot:GBF99243.1 allophanate hydrolase [Raphidocelis subcapitata]
MSGLRLNHQLTELGAKLVEATRTAPVYRMYSLGVRPALIREPESSTAGAAFEVEVWELPIENVGVFLRDGVKAPLALGDVLLVDGSLVKGFVGESYGVVGAPDISNHGGWRSFLASS